MTLQRMMMVASCCLFAITVSARADAAAHSKRTAVHHAGTEKSKVRKRVKPRHLTHNVKRTGHHKSHYATVSLTPPPEKARTGRENGIASWYGGKQHGQRAADGAIFDKFELTAAHRTLPLESEVRVTNTDNGRSITVRVTDRGPATKGRIIDLSQGAAEELGMKQAGTAHVSIEALPVIVKSMP